MVQRWDIITIGNLSRNHYWGESDGHAYRPALCTCTLLQGRHFRLLVDPSLADGERMAAALDRRTGLEIADIDAVFITHAHGDHHYGLKHFPDARWMAAPPVAETLGGSGLYHKKFEAVQGPLFDIIDILHTPGHTEHHYSLRFDWEGKSVVIAADAAVTRDYWLNRRGYFNSEDFEQAAATMDELVPQADVIVPGHDNYFYL